MPAKKPVRKPAAMTAKAKKLERFLRLEIERLERENRTIRTSTDILQRQLSRALTLAAPTDDDLRELASVGMLPTYIRILPLPGPLTRLRWWLRDRLGHGCGKPDDLDDL